MEVGRVISGQADAVALQLTAQTAQIPAVVVAPVPKRLTMTAYRQSDIGNNVGNPHPCEDVYVIQGIRRSGRCPTVLQKCMGMPGNLAPACLRLWKW